MERKKRTENIPGKGRKVREVEGDREAVAGTEERKRL